MMASLRSYQGYSLAEALQTSEGETSLNARRASQSREFYGFVQCENFSNVEGSIEA